MTTPNHPDYERLGRELEAYCKKYNVRLEDFFPILNDQKVIPMLRGKAAEYDAVFTLRQILPSQEWIVNKLNLNPQPGTIDQDIGVKHRRTGIEVIIETKSAARGTMRTGTRSRMSNVPHFKVKCHRSRSNTSLPYNDRYLASEFDVIIANPTNALFEGGTIGEEFELVTESGLLEILYRHYGISDNLSLIDATNKDWRFVLPSAIAEDVAGYKVLPRTPVVLLSNDPNWLPLDQIRPFLETIVREKSRRQSRHNS
jgi:hypothetical protein